MELNLKQTMAVKAAMAGENLFITGSGGVGKSVVVSELERLMKKSAILLAPTGRAALNIGGATLHRTFGIPPSICHESEWMHGKVMENLFGDDTVKTIIIDEISMVRLDVLCAIDRKLRSIKKTSKPFGGLQVIFVGDFFQLAPVLIRHEESVYYELYDSIYCFAADAWYEIDPTPIILDEVMRQGDKNTVRALNAVRKGTAGEGVLEWLNILGENAVVSDEALTLCTRNVDANEINDIYYAKLTTKEETMCASIVGTFPDRPVEKYIKLKKGCRVIICANNTMAGYRNGDSGYIKSFHLNAADPYIAVVLDNGITVSVEVYEWEATRYKVTKGKLDKMKVGSYKQYPLKLGYGITIHKAQGMTLDEYTLDLGGGAFAHGQAYVGISRVRSLDHMRLTRPIYPHDIIIDQEVIDFYEEIS